MNASSSPESNNYKHRRKRWIIQSLTLLPEWPKRLGLFYWIDPDYEEKQLLSPPDGESPDDDQSSDDGIRVVMMVITHIALVTTSRGNQRMEYVYFHRHGAELVVNGFVDPETGHVYTFHQMVEEVQDEEAMDALDLHDEIKRSLLTERLHQKDQSTQEDDLTADEIDMLSDADNDPSVEQQ